jgi:hypothetical protein
VGEFGKQDFSQCNTLSVVWIEKNTVAACFNLWGKF